jgi:hypothetical protein
MPAEKKLDKHYQVVKDFANYLERIRFEHYVQTHDKPGKMIWLNFLAGVARGFGTIIGATLVVAIFYLLIEWLGGIPLIGRIVSDIVDAVEKHQAVKW